MYAYVCAYDGAYIGMSGFGLFAFCHGVAASASWALGSGWVEEAVLPFAVGVLLSAGFLHVFAHGCLPVCLHFSATGAKPYLLIFCLLSLELLPCGLLHGQLKWTLSI